jgi:hypothetical protein
MALFPFPLSTTTMVPSIPVRSRYGSPPGGFVPLVNFHHIWALFPSTFRSYTFPWNLNVGPSSLLVTSPEHVPSLC